MENSRGTTRAEMAAQRRERRRPVCWQNARGRFERQNTEVIKGLGRDAGIFYVSGGTSCKISVCGKTPFETLVCARTH